MELFKEIVRSVLYPYPVALLLLAAGLALLWTSRRPRLGRALATAGLVVLLLFSVKPFPRVGTWMLERGHAPYAPKGDVEETDRSSVRWVVVLSGSKDDGEGLPPNALLRGEALSRLVEGIRLLQLHPEARLLLTGGYVDSPVSVASVTREVAVMLGVDPARVVTEERSTDTDDQIRIVEEMVGRDTLLLVTSAMHMPRAMGMAREAGLNARPAPTHFRMTSPPVFRADWLYPSPHNLAGSELVAYELMAQAWARLTGTM